MKSLIFLLLKSAKNYVLELRTKPGKLVLYLLVVGLLIFTCVISLTTERNIDQFIPFFWLKGIFFAYISIFVITSVRNGILDGGSFFEMNDVNFLFVSPLNPRVILSYGIIRLTKIAFLAGIFILFQANSLMIFGVQFSGIWIILIFFMLCVMCLTIISVIIYNVTNGKPLRKNIVKAVTALMFAPALIYFLWQMVLHGDTAVALELVLDSPLLNFIPVVGWASEGIEQIFTADVFNGLLCLGSIALLSVFLVLYLMFSKTDYYEDVLCATETAFEKKKAMSEGNINIGTTKRNVKVVKTGIEGVGSNAIFRKHLRESFRENRLGFLGLSSLIFIFASAALSALMRDKLTLLTLLQILMWMQIFTIGTGRGLKELYMHYIYMIPEYSFSKILWNNLEIIFKSLIESVLIFGISGVILRENPLVILCVILTSSLFSLLLLGVNYLSLRYTAADMSAGILILLYMIAVMIAIAPGLVLALFIGFSVGGTGGVLLGLLILSAWELVVSLVCFAVSRDILHNCDMPVMKTGK